MDYKLKVSDITLKLLQENIGMNLTSSGYPKSSHIWQQKHKWQKKK